MTMTVLGVQECSFTTKPSFPLLANGKNRSKFSSKTTMVCEICDRFIVQDDLLHGIDHFVQEIAILSVEDLIHL